MNHPSPLLLRRYLECTAFVLLWMGCEYHLNLSPVAGQLLGIPLIAIFQLAIARRPFVQLWARDAASCRIDRPTLLIAAGLVVACGTLLWLVSDRRAPGLGEPLPLFLLVLAGALPAALALRQQRLAPLRRALLALIAAAAVRVLWLAFWRAQDGAAPFSPIRPLEFSTLCVVEFVAFFLVDEVAFRGALDPHLANASASRLHAGCSAVFLSMLWAVWHLPAYNPGTKSFLALFAQIGPFAFCIVAFGTLLSFAARRARTLAPTSAIHAFGNAYVLSQVK